MITTEKYTCRRIFWYLALWKRAAGEGACKRASPCCAFELCPIVMLYSNTTAAVTTRPISIATVTHSAVPVSTTHALLAPRTMFVVVRSHERVIQLFSVFIPDILVTEKVIVAVEVRAFKNVP